VTLIKPHRTASSDADPLAHVARRVVERDARGREIPEPSLGARLGQIGVLGWTIVIPMLLALFAGRSRGR
jgi:ATP synthase protein I